MNIFRALLGLNRKMTFYRSLKSSDKRNKVFRYGVNAIVSLLFCAAFIVLSLVGFKIINNDAGGVVLGFLALIIGVPCAIVTFIKAIFETVLQLTMNRKIIGFIALICIVAAIIVFVILAFKILA